MMLTKNEIDELLESAESRSLDFKEGQYQFVGCKDETKKSELIKDVIAFANTHRMHDAFILIGVREVKNGTSIVVGINDHLSDSDIQQFINSKTTRPVKFSYETAQYEDRNIGVIRIDKEQPRPITVKTKYGACIPDRAYIRRGSSTGEATPEEIYQMASATLEAQSKRNSQLSIFLYDAKQEEKFEKVEVDRKFLRFEGKIPQYSSNSYVSAAGENRRFYEDCAKFLHEQSLALKLAFGVHNSGTGSANDVVIKLRFISEGDIAVICDDDAHRAPSTDFLSNMRTIHDPRSQVVVERSSLGWTAMYTIKKLVAKNEHVFPDKLFVLARGTCDVEIEALIFSDELSSPITQKLEARIRVEDQTLSLDDLFKFAKRYE